MKHYEIMHNFTKDVLISGDYYSLRECVEKNKKCLNHADLKYADLKYADLKYADLKYADLEGAFLEHTNLESVNLRGADLEGANLMYVNLKNANLDGANLDGAYFNSYYIFMKKKCRVNKDTPEVELLKYLEHSKNVIRNFLKNPDAFAVGSFDELVKENSTIKEIQNELDRAEKLWPNWPIDLVHACAIVTEESGELMQACLNATVCKKDDLPKSEYLLEVKKEAVQTGAMVQRFLKNITPDFDTVTEINKELERAEKLWPNWSTDIIYACAIVSKRCGKLMQTCLDAPTNIKERHLGKIKKEAIQAGAMVLRFLKNMVSYDV